MNYPMIILTVFLVIIGLASVAFYIRSQRRMRLQILLFDPWSPVEIHGEVKEKIKVYYKDELVTNVFLTQVKIRNSGNLPIRKEDVVEPLTFEFEEETKIVDWDIINTKPKELRLDLQRGQQKENQLQCKFELLNEEEEATLQIICFGKGSHRPDMRTRIAGAKIQAISVESQSELRWKARKGLAWIVFSIPVFLLALFLALNFNISREPIETGSAAHIVIVAVAVAFGFYFLALGIYWRKSKRFIQ